MTPTLAELLAQAVLLRGEKAMRTVLEQYSAPANVPTEEHYTEAAYEHDSDECTVESQDTGLVFESEDKNGCWSLATVWTTYEMCSTCGGNHRRDDKATCTKVLKDEEEAQILRSSIKAEEGGNA
jgi:hypothetical protein